MAIVQPAFVLAEAGESLDVVLTVPGDTTGWSITADLRTSAKSAAALVTKTVGSGITNTPGASESTLTISFSAANLTLTPGAYVWAVRRTDAGAEFPITDESAFFITAADGSAYPELTNLSEYLAFQSLSETVTDADAKALVQLLAAAETAVRNLCGRQFNYGTYTEYPAVMWTRTAMLRETPVYSTAIDVRYDHSRTFGSETALTYATDFDLDIAPSGLSENGILYLRGDFWRGHFERPIGLLSSRRVPSVGVLKVVYSGGFQTIPHPVKLAVWETVAQRLHVRARGGAPLQSESGLNYSYSLGGDWEAEAQQLGSVRQVISQYRHGDLWVG